MKKRLGENSPDGDKAQFIRVLQWGLRRDVN